MLAAQQQIQHELLARLAEARFLTDELFDLVKPDFLYARPIPERHRIVFYIGHLEAFDWNLLRGRALGPGTFHAEFDRLFAFGIDPVDGGLPSDQPSDWPGLGQVHDYVRRARQALDTGIERLMLSDEKPGEFPLPLLLNVAVEHRLMHAETLAYMFHQLPLDQKIRKPQSVALAAPPIESGMIEIPAGIATLGLPRNDTNSFGWDNEYERHSMDVPAFAMDRYMATNGQYLEFIAAGGYEERSLWSEAGWSWRTTQDVRYPVFWQRRGDGWYLRAMFDEIPLPLDWPVYVSHAEADAYARWAGKALPTEAQWQRAAYGTPHHTERPFPWGSEAPRARHGNFDFQRWDPAPANAFPAGDSAFGIAGLVGNGWEWTSTEFAPFPGFERSAFYPGYSANFFDGKHYVMKGGSGRAAACMLRASFRNWFQPHYQYVYAGFRCVSQ